MNRNSKLMTLILGITAITLLSATTSFGQPGDPCNPDGQVQAWTISVTPDIVNNGGTVYVYATGSANNNCPNVAGSITVTPSKGSCVTVSPGSINASVPGSGSGPILIGTFVANNICGGNPYWKLLVSSATGGHSAGPNVAFGVNP